MKTNYKYYIGIDCGVNTGFAVWDKQHKNLSTVQTTMIHKAMEQVRQINKLNPGAVKVRIEDARQRKWIPRQDSAKGESGKREGAGSVKRDAKIWEDFLRDLGVDFDLVAPMNNMTKIKGPYFAKLTGYKDHTSSHARDAAMLVFGS